MDDDLSVPLPTFSSQISPAPPEVLPVQDMAFPPDIPIPAKRKRTTKRNAAGKLTRTRVPPDPAYQNPNGGLPYSITPEIQEEILGYIGTGAYTETAVQAAGISVEVHYLRMKTDPEYARAIRKARAYAEIALGSRVAIGAKGHNGALRMLERTRPERFAPKQYVTFDRTRLGELSDGDLAELLPHARRALAERGRNADSNVIDITPKQLDGGEK